MVSPAIVYSIRNQSVTLKSLYKSISSVQIRQVFKKDKDGMMPLEGTGELISISAASYELKKYIISLINLLIHYYLFLTCRF